MRPEEMTPEDEEAYDTLVQNGMFRNREHNGKPISGSNADGIPDEDEIAECAGLMKAIPEPVHRI